MQNYRRLRVWRHAHSLALNVRSVTTGFPRTGFASLKTQITTAAESVAFNIVEGCGANSPKEFARFLDIAIRSTTEVESQLELARDYGILSRPTWDSLSADTIDVRRMLWELRNKVLAPSGATDRRETKRQETHNAPALSPIEVPSAEPST
jgi:four helix bundle protein